MLEFVYVRNILFRKKKKDTTEIKERRYREKEKQYIMSMVPDRGIFFTPVKGMIPNTSNLAQNFFYN